MKPAQRAVHLAFLLARSLPGGINRAEGKALASEALTLAGQLAALYAPPVVAPIVGAVLTWAGTAVTSPPKTAGDALAGLLEAVSSYVPDMAAYARRIVRFVDGKVDSDAPNPHPVGLRAPVVAVPATPVPEVS